MTASTDQEIGALNREIKHSQISGHAISLVYGEERISDMPHRPTFASRVISLRRDGHLSVAIACVSLCRNVNRLKPCSQQRN